MPRRPHTGLPLFRYLGGVGARLLPAPMMNIINGGSHADNDVDVQEFMVMPLGFDSASPTPSAAGARFFTISEKSCTTRKLSTNVGDEGGFAPDLKSNQEALDVIVEAIGKAGYKLGKQAFIALDPAASEFYNAEKKSYCFDGKETRLGRAGRHLRQLGREISDLLDRRRLRRRRLGRLEDAHRPRWARRSSSWATTCS